MGFVVPQVITEDRASGALVIDGSLKFDASKSQYLSKTFASDGNRKTWTASFWTKRSKIGLTTNDVYQLFSAYTHLLRFNDDAPGNTIRTTAFATNTTTEVYRDASAWYHIVWVVDTTQSTASDRMKLYVNNVRQTWSNSTVSQNAQSSFSAGSTLHAIGTYAASPQQYYEGSMSQFYFIDGQALSPTDFGYTDLLTNTWRPKKFSGTFTQSSVNDGTTWSSSLTATNGTLSNGANAFDGDLSTRAQTVTYAAGKELTFAPSSAINFTTSLEVYCDQGDNVPTATWNGNTVNPGQNQWVTVYSGAGELSSTYPLVINTETAPQYATLKAVRIDGEILIDGLNNTGVNSFYLPMDGNSPVGEDKSGRGNNWTPVNFGGSAALDKATGAKPILNTVSGGNIAAPGVFGSKVGAYYAVTVPGGIGGGFYLDGTQKPTLNLIRGATYTFDQSDSSNSGHPLVFGTTADGNDYSDGVTTSGTPGSAGAYTKITVPHNAPDTLYYHCSNHSGMGNSTSQTTNEKVADPYAWKNVLALPLFGNDDDVSNQINSGSTAKTITPSGNVVGVTTTSNFYGGSYKFDGTGDYLTIPASSDFEFTGDFTIEWWQSWHKKTNYETIYNNNYVNGLLIQSAGSTTRTWYIYFRGGGYINETTEAPVGEWTHYALVRSGSSVKFYRNGTLSASGTNSATQGDSASAVNIGHDSAGPYEFTGFVQDFRVYKGLAKYTSNFIPASTNPDILPDTPSGVSGSSKLTKITDGAVQFDGTNDSLSIADSADFTFGSGDFTMEAFVCCDNASTAAHKSVIQKYTTNNASSSWFWSIINGLQYFYFYYGSSSVLVYSSATLPNKKWVHCAIVRDGNTLRLFQDGIQTNTGDVTGLTNNDSSVALTIGEDGQNNYDMKGFISNARVIKGTALYTSNFTPPSAPLTNVTNTKLLCCQSNTSANAAAVAPGTLWSSGSTLSEPVKAFDGSTSTYTIVDTTTRVLTNASISVSSQLEIYSNNFDLQTISLISSGNTYQFEKHPSNNYTVLNNADSQNNTPFTGTLSGPISIVRSVGSASVYAFRVDGTVLVDNIIANGNASATNFNPFTTDINTVRGQESGYCTWNPLTLKVGGGSVSLRNGNFDFGSFSSGTGNYGSVLGTLAPSTGKWYVEIQLIGSAVNNNDFIGIVSVNDWSNINSALPTVSNDSYSFRGDGTAQTRNVNGSYYTSSFTSAPSPNDFIGMGFDLDNGIFKIYINGIDQGTFPFTISTLGKPYTIWAGDWDNGAYTQNFSLNSGQKPFKFPPPDGFQPLNAANVRPSTVIARPDQYVGISTWTGDGASSRQINVGFKPDLVWFKSRSVNNDHNLFDTVRGAENTLSSNLTAAEVNQPIHGYVTSFNDTGFTVAGGSLGDVNYSARTYVNWAWKAGGSGGGLSFWKDGVGYATASAAGLTSGNLTGASIGTKQGFSIIKYTGNSTGSNAGSEQELSHNMGKAPAFVIAKNLDKTHNWNVLHHKNEPSGYLYYKNALYLNTTDGAPNTDNVRPWGGVAPTSSIITVSNATTANSQMSLNYDGDNYILYMWAEIPGLQKFGKYVGNLSTDGPFIELGFRPAVILCKSLTNGNNWFIKDNKRSTSGANTVDRRLYLNAVNSEMQQATYHNVDFLSNGFKLRGNGGEDNASGDTIIYAAWAEAPSFNLFGAQSNAR